MIASTPQHFVSPFSTKLQLLMLLLVVGFSCHQVQADGFRWCHWDKGTWGAGILNFVCGPCQCSSSDNCNCFPQRQACERSPNLTESANSLLEKLSGTKAECDEFAKKEAVERSTLTRQPSRTTSTTSDNGNGVVMDSRTTSASFTWTVGRVMMANAIVVERRQRQKPLP